MERWLDEDDAHVFVDLRTFEPGQGNVEALREYWTTGKGAAKIRWGTDGSFARCQRLLRKYALKSGFDLDGFCARLHKRATGEWPTEGGKSGIPS